MTRIIDIIRGTTVDGPGFRTSVYFAGCRHCCPGCHNPQSWDFDAGQPMTVAEVMAVVEEEDFDVTLSGGDPLYHPAFVRELSRAVRAAGHSVWLYTGFLWEDIVATPALAEAIQYIDVVVDGPYMESQRNPDLLFRGSANQRLVSVPATLLSPAPGVPVLWHR